MAANSVVRAVAWVVESVPVNSKQSVRLSILAFDGAKPLQTSPKAAVLAVIRPEKRVVVVALVAKKLVVVSAVVLA